MAGGTAIVGTDGGVHIDVCIDGLGRKARIHQVSEGRRVPDALGVARMGLEAVLAVKAVAVELLKALRDDGGIGRMRDPVIHRLDRLNPAVAVVLPGT